MENCSFNEILLSEDGKLFKRQVVQTEVAVNEDNVFAALNDGIKLKIKDALLVGKRPAGLCVFKNKGDTWIQVHATIAMPTVKFNTGFKLDGEIIVPVFEPPQTNKPRLNVEWDITKACAGKVKLWLLVQTKHRTDTSHRIDECYLVATSSANRLYRIPLSNVYDDSRICMGSFNKEHGTLYGALEAALDQFLSSGWNADLRRSTEKSDAFFRFKPIPDGFETLPVVGQWNYLCERVSTPAMEALVLAPTEGGSE